MLVHELVSKAGLEGAVLKRVRVGSYRLRTPTCTLRHHMTAHP